MSLDMRITVNQDRRDKLDAIDDKVDANKTTIRQRIMDDGIDALHAKLFSTKSVIETMKGPTNE